MNISLYIDYYGMKVSRFKILVVPFNKKSSTLHTLCGRFAVGGTTGARTKPRQGGPDGDWFVTREKQNYKPSMISKSLRSLLF